MCLHDHRDRIELHLLPAYRPDGNPIERVWRLQESVTRNHHCMLGIDGQEEARPLDVLPVFSGGCTGSASMPTSTPAGAWVGSCRRRGPVRPPRLADPGLS